ncbi:putative acyl-activating enzyme 17, peroxisomal [Mucuna pruriens]|uniref:Acyl-activating enzyme 17, peroxisomal n=1 Tax=Mucuna pruriens TaxID=157652 RepID=A0A371FCG0_MUCPR|nr:putative acyl-activating enzyme 17, peroxisomal [Mucuna pruriens]
MAYKSLSSITVSDIESHGIAREDAATLHERLAEIIGIHGHGTPATWQHISNSILNPELPFSFHQMLFYGCYKDYGPDPPAWVPHPESAALTNVWQLLERRGEEFLGSAYKDPITSFDDFQKFSVSNPEIYWKYVLEEMNISFSKPPECIIRDSPPGEGPLSHPSGQWLPGASINPAQNCLNVNGKRGLNDTVIIWRDEQHDDLPLQRMTLEELREEVWINAS